MDQLLVHPCSLVDSRKWLAAFPQFISTGEGSIGSPLTLVFLHSFVNAIWFAATVILFTRLTDFAQSGSFQRWVKGITSVAFIGFGVRLATYRP